MSATENDLPATMEEVGIVNVDRALEDWQAYQRLTHELLDNSDYQSIGDRKFKKKSGWRKYMRAFNISTRIVDKEILKDDAGRVTEASFTIRAWTPDGRESEGWGNCSKFERRFTKGNHDIPATAMTRATNRAISDLIGAGEVSAEEMTGTGKKPSPGPAPGPSPAPAKAKKKPASSRKPAPPEEDGPIVDAEVETHDMTAQEPVNLQELKGVNKEFDKWINLAEDTPTNRRQVLEACQDLIGDDKLEPKEFREIKKIMGMAVK